MSESPARPVAALGQSPDVAGRDAREPAPGVQKALESCLQAVAQPDSLSKPGGTLDALESLLPQLDHSDLTAVLDNPEYRAVRNDLLHGCAAAWFTRECDLARRALDGPAAATLHRLFGDHIPREAYADELAVLATLRPQRILILGSGPCPMSAFVVRDAFPSAVIVGMDRAREACALSAELLAACGYESVIIRHGDAAGRTAVDDFDCILMALTVGEDEAAKRRIIDGLRAAADPDATLVVRTAIGWGRLLYPSVDIPQIASRASHQTVRTPHQRSVAVPVRIADLQL